jgi:hypothetical protein
MYIKIRMNINEIKQTPKLSLLNKKIFYIFLSYATNGPSGHQMQSMQIKDQIVV